MRKTMRRRAFLQGIGAGIGGATLGIPLVARAGGGPKKLIVVILRGALDGLHAVVPVGDPYYEQQRPQLALTHPDTKAALLPLDGMFALHPAGRELHSLYTQGEALLFHAVGQSYRDRSHFDSQVVLEEGSSRPHALKSGWLNRALQATGGEGLSVSSESLLILQGAGRHFNWQPEPKFAAKRSFQSQVLEMLAGDPAMATALAEGLRVREMAQVNAMSPKGNTIQQTLRGMARLLRVPEGPEVAALDLGGWDTHSRQGRESGRFARVFSELSRGVATLRTELGSTWQDTVVACVTEFGRTVRPNGSGGTDHGTGSAAFLFGGGIQGGRVVVDWPGLADHDLYEGRDLRPTLDVVALLKGILHEHLHLTESQLAEVFPAHHAVASQLEILS